MSLFIYRNKNFDLNITMQQLEYEHHAMVGILNQ